MVTLGSTSFSFSTAQNLLTGLSAACVVGAVLGRVVGCSLATTTTVPAADSSRAARNKYRIAFIRITPLSYRPPILFQEYDPIFTAAPARRIVRSRLRP